MVDLLLFYQRGANVRRTNSGWVIIFAQAIRDRIANVEVIEFDDALYLAQFSNYRRC